MEVAAPPATEAADYNLHDAMLLNTVAMSGYRGFFVSGCRNKDGCFLSWCLTMCALCLHGGHCAVMVGSCAMRCGRLGLAEHARGALSFGFREARTEVVWAWSLLASLEKLGEGARGGRVMVEV